MMKSHTLFAIIVDLAVVGFYVDELNSLKVKGA